MQYVPYTSLFDFFNVQNSQCCVLFTEKLVCISKKLIFPCYIFPYTKANRATRCIQIALINDGTTLYFVFLENTNMKINLESLTF
jgi:hypothetical protein